MTKLAEYSPSVRIRRIARVLRTWRVDRDLQGGQVAKLAGWSAAKQSRLETGGQVITPADVMTIGLVLDVDVDERNALFHAALTAQEKGWWEELAKGALVDDVLDYVELESDATSLKTYGIDLIHGLFQTEDYTEALVRALRPAPDEDTVRERVQARLRRQERLVGDAPIEVQSVVAEGALRMKVGGAKVMRAQLNRLLELGDLPHISLRVLPADAGAHPAMGTGFNVLSFGSELHDVVYVEVAHKGIYLEEPEEVDPYRVRFAGMWEVALDEEESARLITKIAGTMRSR